MLTADRLRELLDYDPETGVFTRRAALTNSVTIGEKAGTPHSRGYWQINADGKLYLGHVLAWLWMTGDMPTRRLSFRNGDRADLRWENLRLSGPEPKLTAERLREILSYDSGTGVFRYRLNRGGGKFKGDVAGTIAPNGYRLISIEGREFGAHRLAWLYVHGSWPAGHLDHINRIRDDDRLANLREATPSQNMANKSKQANNTSGYKGVTWCKRTKKWQAQIQCQGQQKFLGYFNNAEVAHAAYIRAAYELFGRFARVA